jgi:hypothetical protein
MFVYKGQVIGHVARKLARPKVILAVLLLLQEFLSVAPLHAQTQTNLYIPIVQQTREVTQTGTDELEGEPQGQSDPIAPVNTPIFGANVLAQELPTWCQDFAQYGVTAATQTIPWDAVEPTRGHFVWTQLDRVLQYMRGCGLTQIGVHVVARSDWAVEAAPPAQGGAHVPSMPPVNQEDYYTFIFTLASHLKGQVQRYSIENEVASPSNWGASPDAYFTMLATAQRAVHDADPQAQVLDGGSASALLGLAMAQEMLDAGQNAQALSFVQRYFADLPPRGLVGQTPNLKTLADLQSLLAQPATQQALAWMPALFAHSASYDALQLHYYAPWELLPQVVAWVQGHLQAQGVSKPLELWELGYGWADMAHYAPQAHAQAVTKLLTLATAAGSDFTIYWSFSSITDAIAHPGLVTPQGARPAAQAYAQTVTQLASFSAVTPLQLGRGVWGYHFVQPSGDLYVLWSETPTTIQLDVTASQVQVTDWQGQTSTADPASLSLDASPIFVHLP